MEDFEQIQKTKNDMISASEIASVAVVIASGFQFCKYLFLTKATSAICDAVTLANATRSAEKISFFIALVACVFALVFTISYDYEKTHSFFVKVNSMICNSDKATRSFIFLVIFIPFVALFLVSSSYGFMISLLILAVVFIFSGKLNKLAMFCVGYFVLSFFMTALLILSV